MNAENITLSDESIEKLARFILAHQRVGLVEDNNHPSGVRDSGDDAGLAKEDSAALLQLFKLGNKLRGPLVGRTDLSSSNVDNSHDSSPTGSGSTASTADAHIDTVGEPSTQPLPPEAVAPGEAVRNRSAYTTNERSPGF